MISKNETTFKESYYLRTSKFTKRFALLENFNKKKKGIYCSTLGW